jgi:hypothetical protein
MVCEGRRSLMRHPDDLKIFRKGISNDEVFDFNETSYNPEIYHKDILRADDQIK